MDLKNYFKKIITFSVLMLATVYSYSQVCLSNIGMSTGKANATDLTIGNFDGDLILDIATANGSNNTVSIFLGNGDGSFRAPLTITPDINFKNPIAITSGDFNKDGFLDLATANGTSDNVAIFLSNGKGGFNTAFYVAVDKALTDIVAGDFDINGTIDIAVSSAGGNAPLYILSNKGGAVFNVKPLGATGSSARALTANNFDKVGGVDFAVSTDLGIDVFLSADAYSKPYSQVVDKYCLGIDSKDINKDGLVDLVVANNTKNYVSVMIGNGNGTFDKAVTFIAGTNPVAVLIDDYNNDGYQDIASTSANRINIIQGDGKGGFSDPMSFTNNGIKALATINLDNKAPIDLVYAAPTITNDVVLVTNTASSTQLTLTASSTNVCPGTGVTFNAGKEYGSYLWFDASTKNTTTASPTATTSYFVIGTSSAVFGNTTLFCKDVANITVSVKPAPTATMSGSTAICAGNTATIPVSFTGTSPWTINYYQGTILKTISGITTNPYLGISSGPTGVQYSMLSVSDASGCTGTVSGNATITQITNPLATISYTASYCKNASNPTPTLGKGATLGTFTSSSSSLLVDINNGIVDLANSSPGTYIVTNTVAGTCGNVIDTAKVVITALPNASFTYSQSAYCSNSGLIPTSNYTGGGASYSSSPAGLTVDAFKGNITISSSLPGTYTVTNTVTGCGVGSATTSLTITKIPDASFSYVGGPFCKNASNPLPTVGANAKLETVNTVYSGLVVDKITGAINLKASSAGNNYMVTNTIAAAGGCSQVTAYASLSIVDVPTATFTSSTTSICTGDKAILNLTFTGTPGYSYTFSDGSTYTSNTNTASITFTPNANTTYSLASVSDKNCTANVSGSVAVTVNPYPKVTFNPITQICLNSPAQILTALPTGGFFTGKGTSGAVFTPSTKGINTVNYNYSALGCTTTVSKNIIVDTLPLVSLSASAYSVCAGSNVTLTAIGANTYTWSNGLPNGATNNITPLTFSNYTVTGTDVNGCTNTSSTMIYVIASPIVKANATANPVCEGTNTSLFGSIIGTGGSITYTWDKGINDNKAFVPSVGQTKYKVQGKDLNGCIGFDSITVTVNPKPVISVSPLTSNICSSSNTNITVTSTMPSVISWSTTGSSSNLYGVFAGNSGKTNPVLNYNIVQKLQLPSLISLQANYNIKATSTLGCISDSISSIVSVDSCAVKADFSVSKSLVCFDNPTVLFTNNSLTGATSTYLWDFGPNATPQTSTLANPPTVTFTATGNQTIKLTVTDDILKITNVKTSTAVYVAPLPTIVAPDQAFCAGTNGVLLKASGANTYSPFANTIVKPTKDTTYQLVGIDLNGCQNTVPVKVSVNPVPNIRLNATPNVLCKGALTQVNVSNQISGIVTTFTWNKNVLSNKSFDPIQTQYFTVTANDINGCTKNDSILITVNAIPLVKASVSNSVVCSGDSVKLNGSVTNLSNILYTWDNGAINNKNFAISTTKKYTLTATETTTLCTNTDTISVTVKALPNVILENDTICAGSNVNLSASGAIYYQWFNGVTLLSNLVVSPSSTTTYKVIGTDVNGCSISKLKTVLVNQKPTLTLSNKNQSVCEGLSTVLNATSNASSLIWNDATITNNVSFIPSASKQYIVTASLLGCIKSDTVNLTVNPNPLISINASAKEVCEGNAVILNATGTASATYTWNNGITNNIAFSPIVSSKYIVNANLNGCIATDSFQINVNKLPVLTATSANTLCNGSSTNISVQTDIDARIKWFTSATNVIGASIDSMDVLANVTNSIKQLLKNTAKSGNITYNISASNKGCIGDTSQVILTVDTCNAKADFVANKTSICSLDSTVLFTDNSQGAATWNWNFGTGATPQTSTSKNPQAIKYSEAGTKTITLIVNGLDGSSDTITKSNVSVDLVNIPVIQSFASIFTQDSLATNAQISNSEIGNTYQWFVSSNLIANNNSSNPTITFNNNFSGKSKLKALAMNAQGCVSDTSAVVTLTRKGSFTVTTPSAVFYNDSIPVNIDFIGSKPYYLFYQNGIQRDTISTISGNNVKFNIARLGALTVTAFDIDSVPMLGFGNSIFVPLDTAKTTISTSTPLCNNNTGKVIFNTTGGNTPLSLKIGTSSPVILTGKDTLALLSGNYTGTITDQSGFVNNVSFIIDTIGIDKIVIASNLVGNIYTNDGASALPIISTSNVAGATNYNWSFNAAIVDSLSTSSNTNKIVYIKSRYSGLVKFAVTASVGNCILAQSDSLTLTVYPTAKKVVTDNKNQLTVDLIGTTPFRVNYSIGNITVDSIVNAATFTYTVNPNETIKINSIRDSLGNETFSSITLTGEVIIVKIPKFQKLAFYEGFSPNNNDDKNQYFVIKNYIDSSSQDYINGAATFTVYDRNGFEVYSVSPYKNDWTGKDSKGADLPDGVYFFVVSRTALKDGKNINDTYGNFVEIRR